MANGAGAAPNPFSLFGAGMMGGANGGIPSFDQVQQQLMQNPDMMRQMMQNPMMRVRLICCLIFMLFCFYMHYSILHRRLYHLHVLCRALLQIQI